MLNKSQTVAAIETMMTEFPDAKSELKADSDFHFLLAVILSAQATDKSVNSATPALFRRFPQPEDLAVADVKEVEQYIKNIGLYKNKAKYLVACSRSLMENYHSQVPQTMKGLTSLAGVGRKTADVVLADCFNIPTIAVDTHVARICKRLRNVSQKDTPAQIEQILMKKLPRSMWIRAHHTLIFWGRYRCQARKPLCETCPLFSVCQEGQNRLKQDIN